MVSSLLCDSRVNNFGSWTKTTCPLVNDLTKMVVGCSPNPFIDSHIITLFCQMKSKLKDKSTQIYIYKIIKQLFTYSPADGKSGEVL